ncbi:hypothetical protein ACN23B_27650 (plasmid) [Anabaena sp. FACHB-709]|uniref:Uncharacterized protein n=2 Tax=Nostocaceae TaxID=1162 RepID=A0A1Z4KUV3_ANAVA|nr:MULTISPECIES: hypothetical protein [Nostocaceae]BAY72673.1 hypothetical protein NIES23_55010 [Trichormus variabilis NIES-23]MBD2174376.1 hypothetical protein [Anabaena cylindrica FACHB-318]MBD2266141.1 hypothetical protein [Anabaena sp. FACHB-709]MBD2275557.1 hypothetical protein [Nostoc sp. PCC 7120 = FACHB-418]MBD2286461.1 hypothetical protein [Anabaena cylindrica FACHB-170]
MSEGEVSLIDLVSVTQYLLSQIEKHPDFLKLEYYPDLTIGDAKTALSYIKYELENEQQLSAATTKAFD